MENVIIERMYVMISSRRERGIDCCDLWLFQLSLLGQEGGVNLDIHNVINFAVFENWITLPQIRLELNIEIRLTFDILDAYFFPIWIKLFFGMCGVLKGEDQIWQIGINIVIMAKQAGAELSQAQQSLS